MKTILFIAISFLFLNVLHAQNNAIKITNLETNEIVVLNEGQRIRVTTVEGRKHSGKLQILDDNSIIVHKTQLTLSEIEKMKAHPLGMTIITSFVFVYIGSAIAGISALVAILGSEPIALVGLIPGGALLYGGFTGTNILQGYHIADGYSYELVKI